MNFHHKKPLDHILHETVDKIMEKVTINAEFDIPYLAGYNKETSIIYMDKDMPRFMTDSKGKVIDTYRYLTVHETIESAMKEKFGLDYIHAHQLALYAERAAVVADGVSWDEYDAFMQKYIDMAIEKTGIKVPANLDLQPYEDCADTETLEKIRESRCRCGIKHTVNEQAMVKVSTKESPKPQWLIW